MFDYHIHSKVSFDSTEEPQRILLLAEQRGLREICFTDHYDAHEDPTEAADTFSTAQYVEAYGALRSDKLKIRRGVEFGLTLWNKEEYEMLLQIYPFDYVLGSVHFAGRYDPYCEEYWGQFASAPEGFRNYLERTLACVKLHRDFDVLGHLTYACKSRFNPTGEHIRYEDYADLCDEILRILAQNGKGLEINTSGVDRVGAFLPTLPFLKRFRELGGEIVTVGSDAHDASRVGQYAKEAVALAGEVFGYVCTFEDRKPIYHKL